jgi:SAM-dependent methyltransferase
MRIRGAWRLKKGAEIIRRRFGYDERNWLRIEQIRSWQEFFRTLQPLGDILEISPGWNQMWKPVSCSSYSSVDFPAFDICKEALERQFQVVIADQVLEHVPHPAEAVRNIWKMLAPGGYTLIATPFLFRVHAHPDDFHRWTETGLRRLCLDGGFVDGNIRTRSWGNAKCVRAHTQGPVRAFGFGKDLSNDPEYPVMVWAFARK